MSQRMTPITRMGQLLAIVGLVATTSACAVLGARMEPGGPPLEVPEAPPRVVAKFPPEPRPPEEVAIETDPAEREQDGALANPAQVTRSPAPRAETTPADEPAGESLPAPAQQLTPATDLNVDAEAVRTNLEASTAILARIDRTGLDSAGRVQYDTARRFVEQATAALVAGSVTFAHYLAEKVTTLALDLGAR